jgi:hypothetical protein
MQHALCCVALVSALPSWQWQQKTKNKFSSIHNQTVVHFHWGEFTCVEFTTNVPKPSQTSHKFQNILLLHEVVVKRHAASRKNANAVCQKIGFSLLLKNESNQLSKNIMHFQENEAAPQTSQIHLQMRSMQQVYFVNNH